MRKLFGVAVLSFLAVIVAAFVGLTPNHIAQVEELGKGSVTILAGSGAAGSGVVYRNGSHSFVWTDAHVVSGTRVEESHVGKGKVLSYKDVAVMRHVVANGRTVGEDKRFAKIIRYDDVHDVAVLYVYEPNYGTTVRFAYDVPSVGEPIWHIGSFKGPLGHNSLSAGHVAYVGRLRRDGWSDSLGRPLVFDQISMVAHQGSSGGGVFSKDGGLCLGLVTEFITVDSTGFPHGALCINPARRMREWAKGANVSYAIDNSLPVPPIEDVFAGPITISPILSK